MSFELITFAGQALLLVFVQIENHYFSCTEKYFFFFSDDSSEVHDFAYPLLTQSFI